ncbi:MAG: Crp/Fnr family transcriptional regulator [Bacteroidales bacterium]|nr:Crp/Fnr family transcriptional regulator [Bacteroidales bacterium]
MNIFKRLAEANIFNGISADEIPVLLSQGNYTLKRYQKNDIIALAGQPCNHLIIIISGSLRAEMVDFSGKTLKVEDITAPRAIASGFLFGKNNSFPVNVLVNEDAQILSIPKDSVLDHLKSNEIFQVNFLNNISNFIHFLTERIYFLSFKTIREKIAQYLLNLSSSEKSFVVLPKSLTNLSEYFGVERPSLHRVLNELEKDGIILADRRKIQIIDRNRLIKIVE